MELNLKEHELILEVSGNSCLGSRGDFILGYRIEYPEKYSLSEEDLSNIQNLWHNMLKNLPEGTIVVKTDIYLKKGFCTQQLPSKTYFQKITNQHFEGRNFIDHSGYIFFVFTGLDTIRNNSIKNPFILPKAEKIAKEDEKLENFKTEIAQATTFINRSPYISFSELTETGITNLYRFWFGGFNPDYVTDIEFSLKTMKTEEKICGILSITNEKNLPEQVPVCIKDGSIDCKADNFHFYKNNLDNLSLTLNCNHIYNQVICIDSHQRHLSDFLANENTLRGARFLSYSNGTAATKLGKYLSEIQDDSDFHYVRANNSVIFWSDDKNSFRHTKDTLMSVFRESNIKPYYPTGTQLKNLLYNSFFTNVSCLDNNSLYLSDLRVPITFFVNSTNYKNDNEGILLNDRIHNIPVMFDFWDRKKKNLQSRNFIIMAPTGGGKSVTNQHILRQLIEDNVIVVIVDLGDSYVKFSKLLPPEDVVYFKYQEGQPIGLNPFAYDGELTADRIEEVCEFVWTLIKRDQIATEEEKTSLRKIVTQYYSACIATGDNNYHWCNFYNFVKGNQDSLNLALEIPEDEKYFNLRQLLHNGSEFMPGGSYYFLFDDRNNQAQENFRRKKLILFELSSVQDNKMLLNIMLLSITSATRKAIWNDKTTRGVVFFDEFAKQLEFPSVLDKVKFYAQAIRKQEGALGLILQSINQLPDTPAAKTILDNNETFLFLNMSSKAYSDTATRLKLNNHVEAQLNSLANNFSGTPGYSEIFILRNKKQNVFRIELPKPILYAYNTEGAVHEEMMRRYEITGNMETVITEMLNEKLL